MILADPTIFADKGQYYVYGTDGVNAGLGFRVYTSTDLVHWTGGGFALKKGESFGNKGFWAPQVFTYRQKYYMAYTANESIAIAVSDHPAGPFRQTVMRALSGQTKQIDPFVLFDKGKIYLYHVRLDSGNRVFVAQLKNDLSDIIPGTLQECIGRGTGWENTGNVPWSVTEGPTVVKRNGKYYLFYSCNDFRSRDYAVGIATGNSPTGPWERAENNPFISRKNTGENGSGHGDVLHTADGKWYYVFHTHHSAQQVGPRRTVIMQLDWSNLLPVALPATFRKLYIYPDQNK